MAIRVDAAHQPVDRVGRSPQHADAMQSSVRLPMGVVGGSNSVAGSFAVLRTNSSDAVRRPGMMTPPMKRAPPATVMHIERGGGAEVDDDGVFLKSCAAAACDDPVGAEVSGSSTSEHDGKFDFASPQRLARVAASMPSLRLCVNGGRNRRHDCRANFLRGCPACVSVR